MGETLDEKARRAAEEAAEMADEILSSEGDPTLYAAEIERLTVALAAAFKAFAEPVEQERAAFRELLEEIKGSYKGSIGSIHNTYMPQLGRERIDVLYERYFRRPTQGEKQGEVKGE